jgi:hypothetical protein
VILAAVFVIVIWMRDRNAPPTKRLEDLKYTGVRITVNLSECQVRSNNWTSEVARYDDIPRVALLNEIGGDSDKNIERLVSNASRIFLNSPTQEEVIFISKDGPCELRSFGLSPTGNFLVVALTCEIVIWSRSASL